MKTTYCSIFLLCLLFTIRASGAPGDLDPSFGQGGRATFGFGQGDLGGDAVAVQSDGKIVVASSGNEAGSFGTFLMRYNSDGSLDASFGNSGSVFVRYFSFYPTQPGVVRIQSNGKILVAGGYGLQGGAVARFNPNGSLDTAFGSMFPGFALVPSGDSGHATGLALQPDGKIVTMANGYESIVNLTVHYYVARLTTSGAVDTSFGGSGYQETPFPAYAAAVSGSTILVTGSRFGVARYTANGSLDPTFNNGSGYISNPLGSGRGGTASAIAIQPGVSGGTSKIVLAGYSVTTSSQNQKFALMRFNSDDGTLDTTFDGDGLVETDIDPNGAEAIQALLIQNTGTGAAPVYKIVAGGYSAPNGSRFVVARYNSGGTLDTSFNGTGLAMPTAQTPYEGCRALAFSANKILAAGYTGYSTSRDVALFRVTTSGQLDTSFNSTGVRVDDFGDAAIAVAKAIAVQPDGKVIIAGYTLENSSGSHRSGRLARLNSDGTFDVGFGREVPGKAQLGIGYVSVSLNAVALEPDGQILAVGEADGAIVCFRVPAAGDGYSGMLYPNVGTSSSTGNAVVRLANEKILIAGTADNADFALIQLDSNLNRDTTFGTNGVVRTDFGTSADVAYALTVQPDGKIVVAGKTANAFAIARYTANGALDPTFSGDGKLTMQFNYMAGQPQEARSVVIQPDGKIVVAGDAGLFVVARFNADGSLDNTFNGNGSALVSGGTSSGGEAAALQSNGKIVLGGHGNSQFAAARFNANGPLDSLFSGDGEAFVDVSDLSDAAHAITLDGSGNILLAGEAGGLFGVARLTGDPVPANFGNISTRTRVGTGDNVLIAGFIVAGTQPKKVIVRAIGPSLPVSNTLANPTLELRDSAGALLASNDNWRSSQEAQIIASNVPPSNDLESAIVATLPANASYTAIMRGAGASTGVGLVEVYDLDRAADSRLVNISTRGFVQTGDNVMIGGFILVGAAPRRVLVRALGPSLPVTGALSDPTLELYNANGGLIASNNDWRSNQEAEIVTTGISPTNDRESAIVTTLPQNSAATAVVRGNNGTTGVALVEVYSLN